MYLHQQLELVQLYYKGKAVGKVMLMICGVNINNNGGQNLQTNWQNNNINGQNNFANNGNNNGWGGQYQPQTQWQGQNPYQQNNQWQQNQNQWGNPGNQRQFGMQGGQWANQMNTGTNQQNPFNNIGGYIAQQGSNQNSQFMSGPYQNRPYPWLLNIPYQFWS